SRTISDRRPLASLTGTNLVSIPLTLRRHRCGDRPWSPSPHVPSRQPGTALGSHLPATGSQAHRPTSWTLRDAGQPSSHRSPYGCGATTDDHHAPFGPVSEWLRVRPL